MSDFEVTYEMRHSTQEEREAYERMLERNSSPLIEEQRIMRRTNRLMMQLGRTREENAERLGINLEYPK